MEALLPVTAAIGGAAANQRRCYNTYAAVSRGRRCFTARAGGELSCWQKCGCDWRCGGGGVQLVLLQAGRSCDSAVVKADYFPNSNGLVNVVIRSNGIVMILSNGGMSCGPVVMASNLIIVWSSVRSLQPAHRSRYHRHTKCAFFQLMNEAESLFLMEVMHIVIVVPEVVRM